MRIRTASNDNFMTQTCIRLHASPHHSCENSKVCRITHLFFFWEPWRCKVIVFFFFFIKRLARNGTPEDIVASRIQNDLWLSSNKTVQEGKILYRVYIYHVPTMRL